MQSPPRDETVERAQQLGGDHLQVVGWTARAVVKAYTGREAETRTAAEAAIELAHRCGLRRLADWSSIRLGFLEVSLGNCTEAIATFEPLMARFDQVPGTEIITAGFVPDADAGPLIDALEAYGRWLDRPWMLAIGGRCRSMWLAAQGDVAGAVDMRSRP